MSRNQLDWSWEIEGWVVFVGGLLRKGEVWGGTNPPVYGIHVRSVVFFPQHCLALSENISGLLCGRE